VVRAVVDDDLGEAVVQRDVEAQDQARRRGGDGDAMLVGDREAAAAEERLLGDEHLQVALEVRAIGGVEARDERRVARQDLGPGGRKRPGAQLAPAAVAKEAEHARPSWRIVSAMRTAIALFAIGLGGCIIAEPAPKTTTTQPDVVATDHRGEEAPPPATGGGESSGPFECHGNESVNLSDCYVEGEVAVNAHGNCSVTLTNCTIRASRLAIDAHGNASVTIIGGSVDAPTAVDAHGNATVNIESSSLSGEINHHGNATVNMR
jgi:hypothetical protein